MEPNDNTPEAGDGRPDEATGGQGEAARIAELEAELAQLRDERLRERAEIENQRRRLARDLEQARKFANERLLGDLLPVLDSLEQGLSAEGDNERLRTGVELTLKQLLKVVAENGLSTVDPTGQTFDPDSHQAMSMVPANDHPANTVVQVYQKGYRLNDRLLRPAMVVVASDD